MDRPLFLLPSLLLSATCTKNFSSLSLSPTCANNKKGTAYENPTTATKSKSRDEIAPSPIEERKKTHITNIKYQIKSPATSYTFLFIKLISFLLQLLQVGMNPDDVRVNGIYSHTSP